MKIKIVMIVAIMITVVGISISYASLSAVIEVTSAGSVRKANWDVHINELSSPEITGDLEIITPPEAINGTTTFRNLNVRFNENNSSVVYYFEIVNAGDLDAVINDISLPTPVCTAVEVYPLETARDIANVCGNLTYELEYSATGNALAVGDIIESGHIVIVKLTFAYGGTELPINEINITGLDYIITYGQNR